MIQFRAFRVIGEMELRFIRRRVSASSLFMATSGLP